ncbi:hypothetical protein QCA50_005940 [Cerrena zonata]|uniref:Uncharacterized protein n=1 Tax=Cerrena zonata TaxID=2478898 RepID=A0AAW0GGJ0_9APHY
MGIKTILFILGPGVIRTGNYSRYIIDLVTSYRRRRCNSGCRGNLYEGTDMRLPCRRSMSTVPVNADADSIVAAYRVGRAREVVCEMGKRPTKEACIMYCEGKELTDSRGVQLPIP